MKERLVTAAVEAITFLEGEFSSVEDALSMASGETLRSLFRACEAQGAIILWGQYTNAELATQVAS